MAKVPISELKSRFVTGHVITQQDWIDLFDSFVHLDAQTQVDSAVVNTAISNYDASINTQNNNGQVDSLGDLSFVFRGFDDRISVSPSNLLKYDSDRSAALDTATSWAPATTQTKWAVQDLLAAQMTAAGLTLNAETVVKDIQIVRTKYTISGTTFYADVIQNVRVMVRPQIKMQV
ncbi:hypothetical protein [Spirosoma aerolatum]|uniref:hypothetical protein n=1 Tax=Spirosoma aerolatum TaxID=1211326 RepID=UPI0009ABE323|nr:hypothetical protein [Spirosoma aerolatum]